MSKYIHETIPMGTGTPEQNALYRSALRRATRNMTGEPYMTTEEMRNFANQLAGRGGKMRSDTVEAVSHLYRVAAEIIDALDRTGRETCSKKAAPKKVKEPTPEEKGTILRTVEKVKKHVTRKTDNKAPRPKKRGG